LFTRPRPDGHPSDRYAAIEAEYLSEEELRLRGADLAGCDLAVLPNYTPGDFEARQRENREAMSSSYLATLRSAESGDLITPAAEWLIDNFHQIEETALQVKRDLPRRFFRSLPAVPLSGGGQVSRALALAWTYAAHSRCEITEERLTALVEGFQQGQALRIGELWALPSLLRFVLLDDLARLARRIDRARDMRERANAVADALRSADSREARLAILRGIEAEAGDNTFASQLLYRLSDETVTAHHAIAWIEERLEARDSDADEVQVAEQRRMSAGNARIGNIIRGLRAIDDIDWKEWFVTVARVDAVLRAGSNFDALDFPSQDQYRGAVEEIARWSGENEEEIAERALGRSVALGVDVGEVLIGPGRADLEAEVRCRPPLLVRLARAYRRLGWVGIAAPVIGLTLVALAASLFGLLGAGVGLGSAIFLTLLAGLPASEAASALFNSVVTANVRPSRLVGFEFKNGVPEECRTLVVIPALIDSYDTVDALTRALEVHYLSHTRGELYFALLSDWPDSQIARDDRDDALLDYARAEIARLAGQYAYDGRRRFFLLHRRRLLNEAEGAWMGWERKRGKLLELGAVLRGEAEHTTFLPLDAPLPEGIEYVMTLDSDTRLTRDAVTKLVGKLAHPMNRPVVDEAAGRVVEGHAILQPRVTPSLTTGAEASAFQRVFSANRGLDPYVFSVSDVYQDLTGEGSFTGKGLLHVDTFHQLLGERIPENSILSHDLLEGILARAALVTDVEVVEDFPVRYEVEASRQHRWARGDWQLAPFLFTHGIDVLGRWKILDNLRRTLVPIAWVAGSLLGWILLPEAAAAGWQLALVVSLFVAPILGLLRQLRPRRGELVIETQLFGWSRDAASALAQGGLQLTFIAQNAALMADAILRTLYRLRVSRRHLLQWRSAALTASQGYRSPLDYARAMLPSIGIGLVGILAAWFSGGGIAIALAFGALWIVAPLIAWSVSRTAETEDRLRVSPEDLAALRRAARRSWAYYEHFVTAEHNWLPPDNFQEIPHPVVANRTSPTNIGCYLLSIVSARDFGWIPLAETVARIENTVATVESLSKDRGHLYNWYDTRTMLSLEPRYVSSVDSGNLAGHLVCLSSACRDWAEATFANLLSGPAGLGDVVGVLTEEMASIPNERRAQRPLRRRMEERLAEFERALRSPDAHSEFPSARLLNLSILAGEFEKLAREFDRELETDQSRSVVRWVVKLRQTCEANFADATLDTEAVADLGKRLAVLRDRTRDLAFSMQFGFLLNERRRLLSIGYRADQAVLDENCYDLLASEARLTSFFGIAKGDLPTEHWFHLGRPLTSVNAQGALVSWSGSMFEYLMPPLVMQERHGGILNQTNRLIVRRQIDYGKRRGVPWGISEAALNARDPEMTYQYQNFGVPSLGLKRGLARDLVVAPYATLLASQYEPAAALRNLEALKALGALGEFGYYDSIDFTPTRLPEGADHAVVRNYMAHHVGMSILAVSNVAFQGLLRDRFHSDPVIEAAELLLQEKAPRSVPALVSRDNGKPVADRPEGGGAEHRVISDPLTADRAVALLSNGHYALMLTARGSGRATWNGLAVTRWRPDPTEDRSGAFVFLRDTEDGAWWSATAEPRQAEGEVARTVLSDSKVEFHKEVGTLRSQMDVLVASEHDAEGRRLVLTNDGPRDRIIEVTSYAEPVLFRAEADAAHPAFAKMFLRTEIDAAAGVIHVARKPRAPGEPDMSVAHMIVTGETAEGPIEAETDRRAFIGRGRTLARAAAFDPGARLSGGEGFTLDPVLSLRRRVRVPAGGSATVLFWTIAAPKRAEVETAVAYFAHVGAFENSAMRSWTRSQVQKYHLGISAEEPEIFQKLARYLVYPDGALRAEVAPEMAAPQSALWPLSISGDFPIFLLRIDAEADLPIARKALRAQEYFRARGLHTDLVLLNEHATSYSQDLQNALDALCENARLRGQSHGGPRDHIFTLRRDMMDPTAHDALLAAARVVFHARNGRLSTQIERAETLSEPSGDGARAPRPMARPARRGPPARPRSVSSGDLAFWNGFGGFGKDGREYILRPAPGQSTPQPWINVISNGIFGFHVAAEGGGFTWSQNSRDYQLTPWSNDAVIDPPGEAFFVLDRDTGEVLSPFPALSDRAGAVFETRHGMGYSRFGCEDQDLEISLTQTVHATDPVKLSRLRITNRGAAPRRVRAYGYVEWVLGNNRDKTAPFIATTHDPETGTLIARNTFGIEYAGRAAFFTCGGPATTVTASRAEFLGAGSRRGPEAVMAGRRLSGDTSATGDPCAAIASDVALGRGETVEILFVLGDAPGPEEARALAARHRRSNFETALGEVRAGWADFLDVLRVETPDPAFDIMVNGWLPYQTLACRLRARSAFYQASGAFGFRDQLQDSLSLVDRQPRCPVTVNQVGRC
jgi:cyclic beta-1,2-glucan synthetase